MDYPATVDRPATPSQVVVGCGTRFGFGLGGDRLAGRDHPNANLWRISFDVDLDSGLPRLASGQLMALVDD